MIIADYINAFKEKDFNALSNCFSENCRIFDYSPASVGKENSFIYGKRAINMFYHNKFVLGGLSIFDPQIIDERTANYYASYGGPLIHVIASIESYDSSTGYIKEMVIRPA